MQETTLVEQWLTFGKRKLQLNWKYIVSFELWLDCRASDCALYLFTCCSSNQLRMFDENEKIYNFFFPKVRDLLNLFLILMPNYVREELSITCSNMTKLIDMQVCSAWCLNMHGSLWKKMKLWRKYGDVGWNVIGNILLQHVT